MLTVTLVVIALGALLLWKFTRRKKFCVPPGPLGLPFFGNVFQLNKASPHRSITEWSYQYGDVMKIKMFGSDFVVLSSFEAIYEALVTKASEFAGRPMSYRVDIYRNYCEGVTFTSYSRHWTFLKKATIKALKMYGGNLSNSELITLDLIKDMNDELRTTAAQTEGCVNMKPIIHQCVSAIISSIMYGHKLNREDVTRLLTATGNAVEALAPTGMNLALDILPLLRFVLRKPYGRLVKVRNMTELWIKCEISNRKKIYRPGQPECFADALFEIQRKCREQCDEQQLTDDSIYGINLDIIFAGTIATAVTLQCFIAVLVNKPRMQQKLADVILKEIGTEEPHLNHRERLAYIDAAILEILRYSSVAPLNLPHYTMNDTVVCGYDIPKDTRIMCNLWKLHHNPEYWEEPWEFKPERFLTEDGNLVAPDHINRKRLLPFGAGRRACLGETFAKNRLFLILTSLIQNFRFLPVSEDKRPKHDPRDYIHGIGIMPRDYQVRLLPRQPGRVDMDSSDV